MIILQTDTLARLLQKNKGHLIITVVNRSFTNCLYWIALKYFLSIIDGWKYNVYAVNVGMTFKIVPTSANTR